MADKIFFIPQQPITPVSEQHRVAARRTKGPVSGNEESSVAFEDVLKEKITDQNKIKFSGHAQQRLRMRNIQFTSEQMQRMTDAVERAASKGARDSLLLVDNIAAVVSVENRTIVTVANDDSLNNNVFTNIDSAVIA